MQRLIHVVAFLVLAMRALRVCLGDMFAIFPLWRIFAVTCMHGYDLSRGASVRPYASCMEDCCSSEHRFTRRDEQRVSVAQSGQDACLNSCLSERISL